MRFYLLHKNLLDFLGKLFKVEGGGSFQWEHHLIIGGAHLLNDAPKGQSRFSGYGEKRYLPLIVSLRIATVCFTFVYTVHTYGLIGVFWFNLSIRMDCYIVTFSALYSFEER